VPQIAIDFVDVVGSQKHIIDVIGVNVFDINWNQICREGHFFDRFCLINSGNPRQRLRLNLFGDSHLSLIECVDWNLGFTNLFGSDVNTCLRVFVINDGNFTCFKTDSIDSRASLSLKGSIIIGFGLQINKISYQINSNTCLTIGLFLRLTSLAFCMTLFCLNDTLRGIRRLFTPTVVLFIAIPLLTRFSAFKP